MHTDLSDTPFCDVLSRAQANQIYLRIAASTLRHADFGWRAGGGGGGANWEMIQYRTASFGPERTFKFVGERSPTQVEAELERTYLRKVVSSWEAALVEFGAWLGGLEQELTLPNYWQEATDTRAFARKIAAAADNALFTPDELDTLRGGIRSLEASVLQHEEVALEALTQIRATLDYVLESSSRLGRKDWMNLLLGALFSIAIGAYLPPEMTRELLTKAGALFDWVLTSAPALPR